MITKIDKVLFIEENPPPWSQYESMGTRYINRFAIDEDDQFEIAAILRTSRNCRNCRFYVEEDLTNLWRINYFSKKSQNKLHLLWAGHSGKNSPFEKMGGMYLYGCESAMVTLLSMSKVNCVTKERFDLYHDKIKKDGSGDFSVGDDLETFIRRIKRGELAEKDIAERGEEKVSHLFRLLKKEERRKLNTKDEDLLYTFRDRNDADVPDKEWEKTEYKHLKFSYSWAYRRTTFVNSSIKQIDSD